MSDPILEALARIENKTDQTLKNQKEMQAEIAQIRQDTKRTAITFGAIGGSVITVGWELIKAKMGLYLWLTRRKSVKSYAGSM